MSSARARREPATQPIPPNVTGYQPANQWPCQVRPRRRQGVARQVRLRRSRRRRMARPSGRQAADADDRVRSLGLRPTVRRAMEEEHERGRHAHRIRQAEMARPAQDGRARPVADVVAGQHQHTTEAFGFFDLLYGPHSGVTNLARFNLPEFNQLYEQAQAAPGLARAHQALREDVQLVDSLRAVEARRLPLRDGSGAAVGARLQVHGVRPVPWKYYDVDSDRRNAAGK